ncbi:hypothetical protein GBAR_LOCUS20550 [Geodia barretti]|uniref:Uncharacterized protein n=1 Tax=Geodia barretti TaxID=519541 RepID=A0AA35SV77_GEOBA|nr:hypothetical protein GBAR_LOCUS20550 [Geodia barretti]
MRVVNRVHGHAANLGPPALPAGPTGLAEGHVHVILVADFPDRGHTAHVDETRLSGRQSHRRVFALAGDQGSAVAGRTHQLPATARRQLHIMNRDAQRQVADWQSIADFDRRAGTALHRRANAQAARCQQVALVPVGKHHQRQVRAAVGIVLDGMNHARHAVVVPLEVHHAVLALVAPTLAANADAPLGATRAIGTRFGEPLLGPFIAQLGEVADAGIAR